MKISKKLTFRSRAAQNTPRSLKGMAQKWFKKGLEWFEERAPREKYLIGGAIVIAVLMGVEQIASTTSQVFTQQSTRLAEVEEKLGKVAVLLHNYNRFQKQRTVAEQRFAEAGASSAHYAHIEGVIKRKARVPDGKFRISKASGESNIGEDFIRIPFSVTFNRIEPGELATFLKEISSDKERPAILSKLSVTTRGSYLQAEVGLDLVARRA